jgi:uncharacterized protein (UPF0218 family)
MLQISTHEEKEKRRIKVKNPPQIIENNASLVIPNNFIADNR